MSLSTSIRNQINRALAPFNVQLTTLTAERRERSRLDELAAAGLFVRPRYSLLPGMAEFDPIPLSDAYDRFRDRIERLRNPRTNDVGYVNSNNYFTSPDMEVLYLLVRTLKPRRVVEVGCGNSTQITRQAIIDGELKTEIFAIDPSPRTDIAPHVDRFEARRLEQLESPTVFELLDDGDFLFIDSSHQVRVANDVARIFCDFIPKVKRGVVCHFHDIFLPFEYPRAFAYNYTDWGEQYMLHALLQGKPNEILWPGHYLQRTRPELSATLPFLASGNAQSFWFRMK